MSSNFYEGDTVFAPDTEERALELFAGLLKRGAPLDSALGRAVASFPEHAGLLADYALLVYQPTAQSPPDGQSPDPLEDAVMAAARRLVPSADIVPSIKSRIAMLGLNRTEVCVRLHIGKSLLAKIERGLIRAETIPARFRQALAEILRVTDAALSHSLSAGPRLSVSAEHASSRPPRPGHAQSYDDAVAASIEAGEIGEADRRYWSGTGPT